MSIPFVKMHGLGNDFVVLEAVRQTLPPLTTALVQHMADRHMGIGFDQLLLITPPTRPDTDFDYRIFNADGSEIGQCGNGARCIARFLVESGLGGNKTQFKLGVKERVITTYLQPDGQVAVDMGIPLFDPQDIPFQAQARAACYSLDVDGSPTEIRVVNVGNPHAVLQVEHVDAAPVETLGKKIACHPRFLQGANVGFFQYIDKTHIRLRVWERGAGETLACGSGACAAVIIGCMQGLLDAEVLVDLPGGSLTIRWPGENQPVWMTGPAVTVFTGHWID